MGTIGVTGGTSSPRLWIFRGLSMGVIAGLSAEFWYRRAGVLEYYRLAAVGARKRVAFRYHYFTFSITGVGISIVVIGSFVPPSESPIKIRAPVGASVGLSTICMPSTLIRSIAHCEDRAATSRLWASPFASAASVVSA